MPYKSEKQRRFFHAAEARGDISEKTVKEFDKASKGRKLPEEKHMASKKYGDMHMGGEHNDVVDEYGKHVEAGKDGSHQERHKGTRGAIHVGSPTELEKHHGKDD